MFAVCQPDVPLNAPFQKGKKDPMLGTAFLGEREFRQDKNFNFVEEGYDSNENWSQSRPREAPHGLRSDGPSFSEESVRSPPEGAEVSSAKEEKAATEDAAKECDKLVGSPLEDNGYGSSSLSIDSPDSSTSNTWEAPAAAPKDQRSQSEPPPPNTNAENSSDSDTAFPVLAEAFQNLQDKKRFKQREKEKHHIHLVMYRRLALLRWIRSLQQKVVDQQNRLQESFDTILDNRKELIRYLQQGMVSPKELAHVGL
uniref:Chromosome 1 open reading frame 216 n=1 Tax=Pelusios castaneus TaxID=367368 RepID=A0A8C8RAY4_9SAUR